LQQSVAELSVMFH